MNSLSHWVRAIHICERTIIRFSLGEFCIPTVTTGPCEEAKFVPEYTSKAYVLIRRYQSSTHAGVIAVSVNVLDVIGDSREYDHTQVSASDGDDTFRECDYRRHGSFPDSPSH
jgi:hypothetical protein